MRLRFCGHHSEGENASPNAKPAVLVMTLLMLGMLALGFGGYGPLHRPLLSVARLAGAIESTWLPASDGATSDVAAMPLPGFAASLVGRWVAKDGTRLIVAQSGEVWSDRGHMLGTVDNTSAVGVNFAFRSGSTSCAYTVTVSNEDVADWRLAGSSDPALCPNGTFERPFSF